jgi:SpoVK/Ycf46/Vps4 family AAA+-type ATPase
MYELLTESNVYDLMSQKQLEAIEQGKIQNERMRLLIDKATQSSIDRKYKDYYIYSPPGLGKTFTVQEFLSKSEISFYPISGNISMFGHCLWH